MYCKQIKQFIFSNMTCYKQIHLQFYLLTVEASQGHIVN